MASTATINEYAEKLARSIFPQNTRSPRFKTQVEVFKRSIRTHNYARTNQFEVRERLIGLQEKFQVLSRDDLSDALRKRASELDQHFERWIPDVLDLLLQLSNHPLKSNYVEHLEGLKIEMSLPATLEWAEVEADDPVDRSDALWKQPDLSDSASEAGDSYVPSITASSASMQDIDSSQTYMHNTPLRQPSPDHALASALRKSTFWHDENVEVTLTEVQVVREILFLCQGFSTPLLCQDATVTVPNKKYSLAMVNEQTFNSILRRAYQISSTVKQIRRWLLQSQPTNYLEVFQSYVETILQDFDSVLSGLQQKTITAIQHGGVVTLNNVISAIEATLPLHLLIGELLSEMEGKDPVTQIENMFEYVCRAEMLGVEPTKTLRGIFVAILKAYVGPIDTWIKTGKLIDEKSAFFVRNNKSHQKLQTLWKDRYSLTQTGPTRCPHFLDEFSQNIFVVGKTVAFMSELDQSYNSAKEEFDDVPASMAEAIDLVGDAGKSSILPLEPTLKTYINTFLSREVELSSQYLKSRLHSVFMLSKNLDAFEYLFLARNGAIVDLIEARLFERLDKKLRDWNDQHVIMDILEDAYKSIGIVDPQRLVVHSSSNPTKSAIEFHSVSVLEGFAFDYIVPWPVSNVIPVEAFAIYRRIALFLSQIRFAKYHLERKGSHFNHLNVTKDTISSTETSTPSRVLCFRQLCFVNTIYDHLTCCIVRPHTDRMRNDLTGTIDQMIDVHSNYIKALEHACLLSRNLSVLKDAITSILDLCISISKTVSNDAKMQKHNSLAQKHLKFLIAGLRGVASSGGEVSDSFLLLADRLDGVNLSAMTS